MRILVVLALGATCVSAQSPLIDILTGELNRNFAALKNKGNPAPYFMGYSVTESESNILSASDGAISSQNQGRARLLDITVRVGSPKFDNYRRVNGQIPNFTSTSSIALDDDPLAIRQAVWLNTDRVYRSASQRLIQIQADEKLRAAATDGSDDFSAETPQVFFKQPPALDFNATEWAARLRKLSAEFTKYPGALNSSISLQTERTLETLVTTEGTHVGQGRLFSRIVITTAGKAADGMDLQTLETFQTDDPARLPKDAEILAAVERAGKNLQDLLVAPPSDPFVGPAILSGRAAGVFFHEIFGHRIEGHRQKDEAEGQTFTKSVN